MKTPNMHEHGVFEHVGFINAEYILVCIQPACACLINTNIFAHYKAKGCQHYDFEVLDLHVVLGFNTAVPYHK